jgi:hypothetical protein
VGRGVVEEEKLGIGNWGIIVTSSGILEVKGKEVGTKGI